MSARERIGTTSRQKQKFMHTTWSKSFGCVAEDEEKSFGKKVGRLQLFDITHRKKNGSPTTTEVVEIMEKLKDKRAEYEAIASSDSSASTVEQIAQLKAEAAMRVAEQSRKYDELQQQLQKMMKMSQ
ncbi:hypothetical protein GOBAR_AA28385 [Gossypium barbadense]|uniref:No apical meristem-associated C-terminal domain-containing protein n=1 Tax=Gossypium barbadense TaxID=3634 RepID=A0A2P5WML0_GOSBA|nr:hypothetical protein GOBAR_AA28385 [Gossypium barbadense]